MALRVTRPHALMALSAEKLLRRYLAETEQSFRPTRTRASVRRLRDGGRRTVSCNGKAGRRNTGGHATAADCEGGRGFPATRPHADVRASAFRRDSRSPCRPGHSRLSACAGEVGGGAIGGDLTLICPVASGQLRLRSAYYAKPAKPSNPTVAVRSAHIVCIVCSQASSARSWTARAPGPLQPARKVSSLGTRRSLALSGRANVRGRYGA